MCCPGLGGSPDGRALLAALAAADVVLMAAYFVCLQVLARRCGPPDSDSEGGGAPTREVATRRVDDASRSAPSGDSCAAADGIAPAAAALACLGVTSRLGASARTAGLAATAVLARKVASTRPTRRAASKRLAGACLAAFYAALGASAPARAVADAGAPALLLATTALAVHVAVLGAATVATRGRVWQPADALVASNACVGGPSTAAAFSQATGRDDLVLPAVASGTVGYAAATALGVILHDRVL